jgi:processive rubber oxygenase RoxA-like protein
MSVAADTYTNGETSAKGLLGWLNALINRLVKNATLWIFLALIAFFLTAVHYYNRVFPQLPEPLVYGSLLYPDQGWTADQRERYYQASQGTLIMPYAWFLALESQPRGFHPQGTAAGPAHDSKVATVDLFSSPAIQARYGLLPDTSRYNPDQLPVGLLKNVVEDKHVATLGEGHKEWLSIGCAACHTGQLLYKGTAIRVDGGQAMWNFSQWSSDLVANLIMTAEFPTRFDRFAERVLKHPPSAEEKKALHESLRRYFASPLIADAINAIFDHTYPLYESNDRTAALGRGVNGEFGLLDQRNIVQNYGPVSFPPLWYTHDFDWVQSVAAIRQPMGRNITEGWGVSIRVEINDPATRYESTATELDMFWMETLLGILRPLKWPEDILGKIDPQKVERGRYLYEKAVWANAPPPEDELLKADPKDDVPGPNPDRPKTGYCARCHAPTLEPKSYEDNGRRYIELPLYAVGTAGGTLGTDPYDAQQFAARMPYTGVLAGDFGGQKQVGVGTALTTIIGHIEDLWYKQQKVSQQCQEIMNGFRKNAYRAPIAYPARPLAGYWTTGPFLHNSSVRTLYQLLGPASEREKQFWVGTFEFDPVEVGYQNEKVGGAFLFDTTLKGNYNAGHEFRDAPRGTKGVVGPALSREDRLAIIEYMKVMDDVTIDPQAVAYRKALLAAMKGDYEGSYGAPGYQKQTSMEELCKALVAIPQPKSGSPSAPSAPAAK